MAETGRTKFRVKVPRHRPDGPTKEEAAREAATPMWVPFEVRRRAVALIDPADFGPRRADR